ncbi:restriction endonuclease subunit S [Sphingomonas faeni]|uniref:restriction endonuclease subunit S n=1 Tax=Sphingomonas faeni TaxID=185950 RepID=UPI0020BF3AE7|nr:restriction endonuclease subunit S [Sphingomonas faeni]MCK8458307.1 restriction endonuclease subunit S [Sphingomonas faeni]
MTDLPRGWEPTKIGDVCKLINGRAFKPAEWGTSGLPIVRIQNLNRSSSSYNFFAGEVRDQFVIEDGELLFAWSGTPGTSFGAHIWNGGRAVLNQHIFKVVFNRDLIDVTFLKYAINQTLDEQIGNARGGVGLRHITKGKFENTAIALPPLLEQRRIVARITGLSDRADQARENLELAFGLITEYKNRLLALGVEGGFTPGRGNIAWSSTTIADVAEVVFDGPFGSNLKSNDYTDEGVRVVRLENIGRLRFIREKKTYISEEKFTSLRRKILRPNDVLVSSFVSEDVRVCLMPSDLDGPAINKADCFCIRVDQTVCLPRYLMYLLASPTSLRAIKTLVHGATRPRMSLTNLKQFRLSLPSIEEQADIVRRIESALARLDRVGLEHTEAFRLIPRLKAKILEKAFRGELVTHDLTDEPATSLLENIGKGRMESARSQRELGGPVLLKEQKAMRKKLEDVLVEVGNWISAQDAFQRCGVANGSSTEEFEHIYADLRTLDQEGRLEVKPVSDEEGRKLYDQIRLKVA